MPIYEFECSRGHITEEWARIVRIPAKVLCRCGYWAKRIMSLTAGSVIEPNGMYQPLPGLDAHGKTREEKISPREYEKRDRAQRDRMLATRDFANKTGHKLAFKD